MKTGDDRGMRKVYPKTSLQRSNQQSRLRLGSPPYLSHSLTAFGKL